MARVLITGASWGPGWALVGVLSKRGHEVIASARQIADLEVASRVTLGCVITCILVSCGTANAGAHAARNEVHMNDAHFVQTSLTVQKGESITLINDALTPHLIANGTWASGMAQPAREPGAPKVKDVQINGKSEGSSGPFTMAGTFKLYCTIHPGMNLTLIVQ